MRPGLFYRLADIAFIGGSTANHGGHNPLEAAQLRCAVNEIPPVLEYLEGEVPESGFMFGDKLGIAEIAIISPIVNASIARYEIDAQRWPKLAAYAGRIMANEVVASRLAAERAMMQAA